MKTAIYIPLWVMFCFGNGEAPAQRSPDRPNIVFILADDLGIGDIGPYGQQINHTHPQFPVQFWEWPVNSKI